MRKSLVPLAVAFAASAIPLTPGPWARAVGAETQSAEPSCEDVAAGLSDATTVGAALASNEQLSILTSAVESAGLSDVVNTEEPITLLAPSDSAFAQIPANVFDSIVAEQELLATIIGYHVVPGDAFLPGDLADAGTVASSTGDELTFSAEGGDVLVNGTATICGSAEFGAGTILIVDSVLLPGELAGGPGSSAPGSPVPGSSVPALDAEQEAVATAFETAVDSSLTYDEQAPFIEDAEALRETIENYPTAAEVVMGISAEVTSVTIDDDTAAITYVLSFNGVDAGYGELEGTMTVVDGGWVVPHDEFCAFQAQARNNCPA